MLNVIFKTLKLTPLVFLRMVPAYTAYLFFIYCVLASVENIFVIIFLLILFLPIGNWLMMVLALRAGLVQLKATEALAIGKLIGASIKMMFFYSLLSLMISIWLVIAFASLAAVILVTMSLWIPFDYTSIGAKFEEMLEFESLADFNTFATALVYFYGLPAGINWAILAPSMAGQTTRMVHKPKKVEFFLGLGDHVIPLSLMFFAGQTFSTWMMFEIFDSGLFNYITDTYDGAFAGYLVWFGPFIVLNFLWLPFLGAGGAAGFEISATRQKTRRQAEIDAMLPTGPTKLSSSFRKGRMPGNK